MAETKTKSNNLTSYIKEVESKERARKKVVFFSLGGILLVAAVGLVSFLVKSPGKGPRKVAYDDLSIDKVSAMFEVDNTELIVEYPDHLSPDTIRSVDDYLNILVSDDRSDFGFEQVSRFEPADEFETSGSDEAVTESSDENTVESMEPYRFAIEGRRKSGEEMMFAIQDYDSEIAYKIDFGNGVTRKVGRFTRYTYPRPGRFLVNLIAENEHQATSTFSRFIEVLDKQEEVLLASTEETIALPEQTDSNEEDMPEENAREGENDTESLTEEVAPPPAEEEIAASDDEQEAEAEVVLEENAPPEVEEITGPLIFAEKMPEFPGGRNALGTFLRKKIKYPKEAIENKIEGRVYLRFVVEADGSISNPIIVRGIGYGCDQEAIRLAKLMPKWVPGEQNGRKVPVYAEFLVNFKFLQ